MTIDEALKILRDVASEEDSPLVLEERESIRLGIAALKLIIEMRRITNLSGIATLEGESRE